jgi:hypothetical protein
VVNNNGDINTLTNRYRLRRPTDNTSSIPPVPLIVIDAKQKEISPPKPPTRIKHA